MLKGLKFTLMMVLSITSAGANMQNSMRKQGDKERTARSCVAIANSAHAGRIAGTGGGSPVFALVVGEVGQHQEMVQGHVGGRRAAWGPHWQRAGQAGQR
jgi:hypothetical protein